MNFDLVSITPDMAKVMLLNNSGNRAIRRKCVELYKREMLSGLWQTSHQGIAISQTGEVLDGQHRLTAIAESGVAVKMYICTGVPSVVFSIVDSGLKRSLSDRTKLPKRTLEVIKFIGETSSGVSSEMSIAELKKLDDLIGGHIVSLTDFCSSSCKNISVAGVRAAAVIWSLLGDREYAFSIYRNMVLGNYEKLPSVANNFMKQVSIKTLIPSGTSGADHQMISFVKAMIAFNPKLKDKKIIKFTQEEKVSAILLLQTAIATSISTLEDE